MSKKHCIQQLAEKITGSSCSCRTVKDGLKIIAQKACGDDKKEFNSICDALDCINEHFDNLGGGGSGGGSVKLYAWNNPDDIFRYQRVYTYSENPQVNDVVICGDEGDTQTEIEIGKIESVEDGVFVVDLSICCKEYNTRCPDDDIELTVNSSGSSSDSGIDYVWKVYSNTDTNIEVVGYNFNDYINDKLNSITIPSGQYKIVGAKKSDTYHHDPAETFDEGYWFNFIKEIINDEDTTGVTYNENEKIITLSEDYSMTDDCNSVDCCAEGLFFLQKV